MKHQSSCNVLPPQFASFPTALLPLDTSLALDAVLENPRVLLDFLKGQSLLWVEYKQLFDTILAKRPITPQRKGVKKNIPV